MAPFTNNLNAHSQGICNKLSVSLKKERKERNKEKKKVKERKKGKERKGKEKKSKEGKKETNHIQYVITR